MSDPVLYPLPIRALMPLRHQKVDELYFSIIYRHLFFPRALISTPAEFEQGQCSLLPVLAGN